MEYLERLERKNFEFQEFMREKGKKALGYFKRENEIKKSKENETKKLELKNKIKQEENLKSKKITENFREIKNLEKQKEDEDYKYFQKPNAIEKIYNCFHNLGNKIDYSNTRFHNVVVVKHDEEELNEFISAQEKAIQEALRTENTKKIKKKSIEKFVGETKISSKQILKKEKAKENLIKLQEELNKINDFRNRNKSSKNLISGVSNNNPKYLEKKSENLTNALLKKQRSKSRRLRCFSKEKNNKNNQLIKTKNENSISNTQNNNNLEAEHPNDISEFYRDNEYLEAEEQENHNKIESENIRKNIINLNEEYDMNCKNNYDYENKQSIQDFRTIKTRQNIEYEEPVLRDAKHKLNKEQISRLNPVDFEIYNKIDSTDEFNMQHKNANYQNDSNSNKRDLYNPTEFKKTNFNNENNDQSFFSVNNFKNTGNPFIANNLISTKFAFNKNQINSNINESENKNNAYDSVVGKIIRAKEPEIRSNFITDKNEKIKNANVLVEEFMKDITKGKPLNINAKKIMDFSNDNEEQDTGINENMIYCNKQNNNCSNGNGVRKNNFVHNKNSATKKEDVSAEKPDNVEKDEFKRDDSKWKFSKNELLERKKKLLKDKSNIKKVKK